MWFEFVGYFVLFHEFIFATAKKKKINGIPTENKDNMISSIAKMSEGGRPKNKWQVKICKPCQKGRLEFFSISSELETQLVVQDFLISKH